MQTSSLVLVFLLAVTVTVNAFSLPAPKSDFFLGNLSYHNVGTLGPVWLLSGCSLLTTAFVFSYDLQFLRFSPLSGGAFHYCGSASDEYMA
jgi:hypothetical protein